VGNWAYDVRPNDKPRLRFGEATLHHKTCRACGEPYWGVTLQEWCARPECQQDKAKQHAKRQAVRIARKKAKNETVQVPKK
jgi:transcription initiation factor IIE alpha subunit